MARKFWEKPVCGIYKITHRDSGKCYIGQSVDVFKRWKEHSNLAVKKKSVIQNAFVLYGIDKFSFEVVEECSREMLNDREVHWISYFNSVSPNGYNLTSGGGQGTTVSDEIKAKMSASRKGKKKQPHSDDTKAKMSAAHKGKTHSEENRAKISASQTGKTLSEEHRAKVSASKKGKTHSEETRAKMSAAHKGKQVECPHCSTVGGKSAMKRYHFENCKIYKELGVPKLGVDEVEEGTPEERGLTQLLFPK